jgi:hypothetical protein
VILGDRSAGRRITKRGRNFPNSRQRWKLQNIPTLESDSAQSGITGMPRLCKGIAAGDEHNIRAFNAFKSRFLDAISVINLLYLDQFPLVRLLKPIV